MSGSIGSIVALAALAWVALLVAAPLLPVPAAGLLYAIGSLVCHQIAERSFHLDAYQLPVCARCFGLYAGGALGSVAAAVAVLPRTHGTASGQEASVTTWRRQPRVNAALYTITLLAALPTLITFWLEWGAGWPMSNMTRAVAAVPLGLVVAFVVVRALATVHYGECAPRRPIGHGQPPSTSI